MYFSANPLIIGFGLFVSGLLCSNCQKDPALAPVQIAPVYLDFERSVEPFQSMPSRSVDPNAENNGCLNPVAWNQYYDFNVCIASTCELSDYAIERSDAYARMGNSSVRFFLKPTPLDKWPLGEASHRAELGPRYNAPVNRYPSVGQERWYGMSILFPKDFVFAPQSLESELRFSFAQWQHGTAGPPTVALEVYGDKIMLARSGGNSMDSEWIEPELLTKIKKGEWIDIVLQVKWSKEDGLIKVWVDDKLVYQEDALQTVYQNLEVGGGYKIGLYYWRWQYQESVKKSLDSGIDHREVFIDEVKEYIGKDGYQVVAAGTY